MKQEEIEKIKKMQSEAISETISDSIEVEKTIKRKDNEVLGTELPFP